VNNNNNNNHQNNELALNQIKNFHNNIALRLEDIVNTLQLKLLPVVNDLPSSNAIILSLAELKQIKDVMSGNLPVDTLPPI